MDQDHAAPGGIGTRKHRPVVTSGPLGARIVAAAAELLDESGNEAAVTLRAIARRAGVSAPAIYGHYPDVPSILLVVVQDAFAELGEALRAAADTAADGVPPDAQQLAVRRLRAMCTAYLDFAARRPQRYRIMFGGLWTATRAIESSMVSRNDVEALGQDALALFVTALRVCVHAGASGSDDPFADAVSLWLGLHGLAHQRGVTTAFPWPADIEQRIVSALSHLTVP